MSYKLLQINQLSGIDVLGGNYNSYTMYKNDLLIASVGSQTGSLSTVKLTLDDVTNGLYASFNTNAPIICAGLASDRRVYLPTAFNVGIGQDFSSTTPPAALTVNGSISSNGLMTVGDGTTSIYLSGDIKIPDNDEIRIGSGADMILYHSGSHSYATNATGHLYIENTANDKDITLRTDDGSGGLATYLTCVGSDTSVQLAFGGSTKLTTKTDGVDITGELQCDTLDVDGTGHMTDVLTLGKGSGTGLAVTADATIGGTLGVTGEVTLSTHLNMGDNDIIKIGDSADLQISHVGSNSDISNSTGNLTIVNNSNDHDITLKTDDGSGGVTTYLNCDGDTTAVTLNFGGSTKLTTKTDGVDITGELQSDTLDVDGNGDISGNLTLGGSLLGAANVVNSLTVATNGTLNTTNQAGTSLTHNSLSGIHGMAKAFCVYSPSGNAFYIRYNIRNSVTRSVPARYSGSSPYNSYVGNYEIYTATNTEGAGADLGYRNCALVTLRGTAGPATDGNIYELGQATSIYAQGTKSTGFDSNTQYFQIEILRAYYVATNYDGRSYYRYGGDNASTNAFHFVLFEQGAIS